MNIDRYAPFLVHGDCYDVITITKKEGDPMPWFDGTLDSVIEELENEFPVAITKNLRQSADGKRIAIINDFQKDTEAYRLLTRK